jgi:hypothetical protein
MGVRVVLKDFDRSVTPATQNIQLGRVKMPKKRQKFLHSNCHIESLDECM